MLFEACDLRSDVLKEHIDNVAATDESDPKYLLESGGGTDQ